MQHHMEIVSPAFEPNQPSPQIYGSEGKDISPPLRFINVPEGTETLALIVDDPDAPGGTFVHWVLWNIPGVTEQLSEGAKIGNQGKNHYDTLGYRGPRPPVGETHRYYFKLYALNTTLTLPEGSSKSKLEHAMKDHIITHAEVIGTFQR